MLSCRTISFFATAVTPLCFALVPLATHAQVSSPAPVSPPVTAATTTAKKPTFITSQVLRQENVLPQPSSLAKSIPFAAPPGAVVTLEIDARDGDLLGMVKDLLSGMGDKSTSGPGAMSMFGPMSGMQIDTVLKDVTHLRLIQFKKLNGAMQPDNAIAEATQADALGYYEKQFVEGGGRRLLYTGEGTRILIMGFDAPRGMAFVTEDGSKVTVGRIAGKVNVKMLSTMIFGMAGKGDAAQNPPKKPIAKPTGSGAKTSKKAARN